MRFIHIAQAGPMADAPRLSDILLNVLNFVLMIVGVLAVLVVLVSGVMYITSGGDSERVAFAKKALVGGVIGILVAVLALVIVHAVTSSLV